MKKGATTLLNDLKPHKPIIALRNEKGSYNLAVQSEMPLFIIALRNEKGSYNRKVAVSCRPLIIALRNEKGSYNRNLSFKD